MKKDAKKMQKKFSFNKMRDAFARRFLSVIYGKKMHLTSHKPTPLAGVVSFWYMENNMKHYIFAKEGNNTLRFPSCLGLQASNSISESIISTVNDLFGTAFMKSFNKNLLAMEKLTAMPVFSFAEADEKTNIPVHTFVWDIQLTPEQAQLCQPTLQGTEVLAVPEIAIKQQNIAPSHIAVLNEIKRVKRQNNKNLNKVELSGDLLEELIKTNPSNTRTIH